MKKCGLTLFIMLFVIWLDGCGMQESMITEEIFEPIIETPSFVEEASVSDMEGGTKRYVYQEMYDPEVPYIPELDYHTFARVCPTDRYPYICWKDMLILGNVIYKRENGVYTKTKGSLSEWLGIKNDLCLYQFNQWENFLILSDIDQLVIFDMDSEELVSYPFEHGYNWYVFQGKVYYREVGKGVLCMDIQSGKNEVIYACKGGGGMCIRDNGDIIISTGNEINPKVWEFWLLSYNVQGDMDARKIWETDKFEFVHMLDFYDCGLFFIGEYYSYGSSDIICLGDDGKIEKMAHTNRWTIGQIIMDAGYFLWDSQLLSEEEKVEVLANWDWERPREAETVVDSISYYDFQDNKLGTWQLINDEMLEIGYRLANIVYGNGEIIALYENEELDDLYISKVQVQ